MNQSARASCPSVLRVRPGRRMVRTIQSACASCPAVCRVRPGRRMVGTIQSARASCPSVYWVRPGQRMVRTIQSARASCPSVRQNEVVPGKTVGLLRSTRASCPYVRRGRASTDPSGFFGHQCPLSAHHHPPRLLLVGGCGARWSPWTRSVISRISDFDALTSC